MNDLNYTALRETLNATDQQYLIINHPVTNKPIKIKIATFIDIFGGDLVIGADNGLTIVGNSTELGGILNKNTDIDFSTFDLSFSNVDSGTGTEDRLVIDGSGNIKKLSVSSAGLWSLTGNGGTTAGTNFIGTTDAIDVVFKRDSTEKMRILSSSITIVDNVGIGGPTISARLHVKGSTSDNTAFGFKIDSSADSNWFNVRNDGAINVFGGGGNDATFSVRQRDFAFPIAFEVYGNTFNRLIRTTDNGTVGAISLANETIGIDMYAATVRIGGSSPGGTVRLDVVPISGGETIYVRAEGGTGGTIIGDDVAGSAKIYLQATGAATTVYIRSSGDSYFNGGNFVVGAAAVTASAKFEIVSTTLGFLPPRMTTAQRDLIGTPSEGLVIYNTTTQVLNFYNGAAWGAV